MPKLIPVLYLLVLPLKALLGQSDFPELVEHAFGSDQELINGVQFSNHFGQIGGHPYFLDETFRDGNVYVTDQLYEHLKIRYNLYTQKVEVEYAFSNGSLIQYMSVPEHMPSFSLEGRTFVRRKFGDEEAAYYQEVRLGSHICYIGWRKEMKTSRNDSFRAYEFSLPKITYRLMLDADLRPFHNRKTFVEIFPEEMQKDILKMLKQLRYSFKNATVVQAEEMILAALGIYQNRVLP